MADFGKYASVRFPTRMWKTVEWITGHAMSTNMAITRAVDRCAWLVQAGPPPLSLDLLLRLRRGVIESGADLSVPARLIRGELERAGRTVGIPICNMDDIGIIRTAYALEALPKDD